ncbi:GAF domain-containing protein [Haloarcula laminariae]|uniref:GAF domain-containing protein n=1 Tax=Haloarcula laminariae TaxID=2961577 RepID=UPI002406978E|nr:GAF domain-containing protein [Halomicroarcula sp. FL173]
MGTLGTSVRVLHVDDDPDFAETAAAFLERDDARFEVETATSASAGLDRLADEEFDCVVSDYEMPGRNGIEFLEAVSQDYPDLPFILYTGRGSEEVASDAISAGVTDYLQKGTGTSQYTVLANRISNAVEQYRTNRRAAELDRVRTLASDINQAIVRAESPREVKARACEIISASEPYLFAWIGDVDPDTGQVEPEVSAGTEDGYLDTVTVTTDDDPTGQGPVGTAISERRVAVSQNIAEDPAFEPWRADAIERGYRAAAAVPLEYQDTLYGALVVYAERTNSFDENERELLAELGRDIAHVLHSFDVRARLREEREFIEQALDSLNDVFYVLNADGTFRRWNDQLSAVTGYGDEELAEIQAIELFPEGEREKIADAIEEALTTGETTVESEFLTADGEHIPYEFTGSQLTSTDDRVGLIGIGRDLTARKQRERRLQRLIDTLPGMVYRCRNDPGRPTEEIRGNVREITGYDASELERTDGLYGEGVVHPDDREERSSAVQNGLDAHEAFEVTYRIRTEDGEVKWVWERGQGVYADDGEPVALEGFITDITEREQRKLAVDALHETAQSVMRADTAAQVAEITVDTISDVLDMPANGLHLYDEDEGGLVPAAWTDRTEEIVGEPPTIAPDEGIAGNAFETGRSQVYSNISTVADRFNPNTSVRSQIAVPLDDHGVLLIGSPDPDAFDDVDVSLAEVAATHATTALDHIEHERELERQNERLEEFAGIVSHDLRNPLTVAEGHLELAREECDSEHLSGVAKMHDRMTILIDDLLALAHEGEEVTDPETVDLSDLVENCWHHVETADATLVGDVSRTLRADRSRLEQLLENLFRNAVEHGSTGPDSQARQGAVEHGDDVTVTVGGLSDGFYVADDGPGIPEGDYDRIFESGYSTSDRGTGFGLAIVREIVEAHGWRIRATDSETGGARFEITGVESD